MSAIPNIAALRALRPTSTAPFAKTFSINTPGLPLSLWTQSNDGGATATTAEALSASSVGALPLVDAAAGEELRLLDAVADMWATVTSTEFPAGGWILVCDRLSHQGGLAANVTTTQTTNLPTAALPRYTSGEGVWAFIEPYASLGGAQVSVSVSYTNQAGTAGRTSPGRAIGGTGRQTLGTVMVIPLAAGDSGVRSVESVTLAASTTGAGAFGVTLMKPLLMLPIGTTGDAYMRTLLNGGFAGGAPVIQPGACLSLIASSCTAGTQIQGSLSFVSN